MKSYFLQIQNDFAHVFDNTGDRLKLMLHICDLYANDGRSLDRRKEDATKRVADRCSITLFEGIKYEASMVRTAELFDDDAFGHLHLHVHGLPWVNSHE